MNPKPIGWDKELVVQCEACGLSSDLNAIKEIEDLRSGSPHDCADK